MTNPKQQQNRSTAITIGLLSLMALAPRSHAGRAEDATARLLEQTGLQRVEIAGSERDYFGKHHRGYPILFHAASPHVWKRWTARVAAAELAAEVDGIVAYLFGATEHGSGPAGSVFDRTVLSRILGQPMSLMVVLNHGQVSPPRLDIYPRYAIIKPDAELPKVDTIGRGAGDLRSADASLAAELLADDELIKRLKRFRGASVRLDGEAVAFLWAGQEKDYAAMIRDHGNDYAAMLAAIFDSLADIADAIKPAGDD